MELEKPSLCNHHSKDGFRQESLTDAKLGVNFEEDQDICWLLKVSAWRLRNSKGKIVSVQGRHRQRRVIEIDTPIGAQVDTTCQTTSLI